MWDKEDTRPDQDLCGWGTRKTRDQTNNYVDVGQGRHETRPRTMWMRDKEDTRPDQ